MDYGDKYWSSSESGSDSSVTSHDSERISRRRVPAKHHHGPVEDAVTDDDGYGMDWADTQKHDEDDEEYHPSSED